MRTALTIPYRPGGIDSPDRTQIDEVLRNESIAGGCFGDVALEVWDDSNTQPRKYRKLWFWIKSAEELMAFYEGDHVDGWWIASDRVEDGESFVVEDAGGCDIRLNTRFLIPTDKGVEFACRLLNDGQLDVAQGWESAPHELFE